MTRPANASEMPSWSIVGRSAATNQSDTNAAPAPPSGQQRDRDAERRRAARAVAAGARRGRVAAHVRDDPGDVDDEQRDRADRRDARTCGRPGRARRARARRSTMMKPVTSSSVAVSLGSRRRSAWWRPPAPARADDDHHAEHEQRVREQRADDRRLRDDGLALAQREDDDEQLGQVAERRLHHPGDGRARTLAHLLGGETDDVRQAGERDGRERERQQRGPAGVVRDARQRGRHPDDDQHDALAAAQARHGREDTAP